MGYPRRITMVCHKALKQLIMSRKNEVDLAIVKDIINQDSQTIWKKTDVNQQRLY